MSDQEFNLEKQQLVDKIKFDPIRGEPRLNWKGKRPFESTQFYPAEEREVYGTETNEWFNKIFWGDNLQVMSHMLKDYRGKIDLIYIDPPYDSKADYKKKIELRGKKADSDRTSFEEKQYTDIWTNDEYLQFMYERLILLRELLSDNGSIFVHCDWHKVHHLRCIIDEVFGQFNFVNEIIWTYTSGGKGSRMYARKHDNILFYSKNINSYYFDIDSVRIPYSEKTLANYKEGLKGSYGTDENLNPLGKVPEDFWEIAPASKSMTEVVGYPTQKPLKLLERIILGSCKPDGIVFDCFMGSGTAQVAAMKLGRRFIGADINLGSVQTTTKRLLNIAKSLDKSDNTLYTGFKVYNVNNYDVFRNPIQAKEKLIEALEIQKLDSNIIWDGEKDGRMVKIMPVNRIATESDLSEIINNIDYKLWEKRKDQSTNTAVEKITLVSMGHEPSLSGKLEIEFEKIGYKVEVEVVDILRDKSEIKFKRDSEAKVSIVENELVIDNFYPMNLLQKLSLQDDKIEDWRDLVETIMIDWNYDGVVMQPSVTDIPSKTELVKGSYQIPSDAGRIKIKITDLISESLEIEVDNV